MTGGGDVTVVGIGASAGGLDAFRSFFEAMPPGSGMAFVVVLHLPANRRSMLPDILGRWTAMPIVETSGGDMVRANCVYVPPPHAITTLRNGRLQVRLPAADAPRPYRPIDVFFDSLAASLQERAIGIVLSGTGTDGALGLKAIKERGGFTLVQGSNGTEPQYNGMPAAAIATGAVDLVAPVEAMPGHLIRLQQDQTSKASGLGSGEQIEAARLAICAILRDQLGHDFSGYKDRTFLRRVQRRMHVLGIGLLDDYVARLEHDRGEVDLLFRDLLIRVTSFFRDHRTFETLERTVVPRLFAGRTATDMVRVWVPGCATGEEAYSLAMLLHEHMDRLGDPPKVQIFATDIDESAIATARAGRYPATLVGDLDPARRQRFFNEVDNSFVIAREIREMCTFSVHSLVRDPPYSRINLISCRNLLIYLDLELQASVIPAFHYSLVADGILLLGNAETTTRHEELFVTLDPAARIFLRRDVATPPMSFPRGTQRGLSATAGVREPPWPDLSSAIEAPTGGARSAGTRPPPQPGATIDGQNLISAARGGWRALVERLGLAAPGAPTTRQQLVATRERLASMGLDHESALEELRSANEELHSVNEELQSTNEELETSKEELQSINEELHTVNAQLSDKVDELDRTNSDLRNLFDSTDVASIFLDQHLIIRGFTPAVGSIYNLIPSDHGRPLTDIVNHLRYSALRDDVHQVLSTLQPLERRVTRDDDQAHYIMRVLPYRGSDSSVNGTLVTFVDVTSIVRAEARQRQLVEELNHRVKDMLGEVSSIAAQTLHRVESLDEFSNAFLGRVQALTASYTLLGRANWVEVALRDLVIEATRPFLSRDRPIVITGGPPVQLAPRAALAMGMALHELATNAVKHGALSVPSGSVDVTWRLEEATGAGAQEFVLDWVESGGPPVEASSEIGVGMTVIERRFAAELSAQANVAFTAQGVRATLRARV